jgi:hypothetical protein
MFIHFKLTLVLVVVSSFIFFSMAKHKQIKEQLASQDEAAKVRVIVVLDWNNDIV